MSTDRVSPTRRVAASAGKLFVIVSDPSGQVAIDGSGMLVAAPDAVPLTAVGRPSTWTWTGSPSATSRT